MDLIYMNAKKEDVNVMPAYTLDLAYGSDENDFECKISKNNHCCDKNFFLYIEGTEYGGIIDDIGADTASNEVIYYGRTWHGILNSKVLCPDENADYLTVSGEVNTVLSALIDRMGLNSLFKASEEVSGIELSNYQFERYIKGYDGIKKMLKTVGAKLIMSFEVEDDEGFVVLSAKPIVDYSEDEQFDTDLIELKIRKKYNPLNHVICLGKGDLAEREVIHVYADKSGEISENQVFTGIAEVVDVYENVNAENSEELKQGGIDKIKKAWASDELDFNFNEDEENYDVGDIVGAYENVTKVEVKTEITKKIVKIDNGTVTISYPCDSSTIVEGDDGTTSILGNAILGTMILGGE